MKNWFVRASNCSRRLASATNRVFSVQHTCGLSTTPTLFSIIACSVADATAHAQALCWKWLSSHKTAVHRVQSAQGTVGLVCYAGLNLCDFVVKSIMRFLFMR